MSPSKPGKKSYDELVEALSKHFKPAPSEIVERLKFHSRSRKAGESVATFVAELRSLAEFCNFGGTLETMLRDHIVCEINDDTIQKRLLSEPGLDYAKAVETTTNMETAAQSVRELKSKPDGVPHSSPVQLVHKTRALPPEQGAKAGPTCYRCGIRDTRSPTAGWTKTLCVTDMARKVTCSGLARASTRHLEDPNEGSPREFDRWRKKRSQSHCQNTFLSTTSSPQTSFTLHLPSR